MTRIAAVMIATVVCATTSVARADATADEQRADALFEEGKSLRGAGRYQEACADFEESRRLDDGIGVTLYLADCYEQAGNLPRALAEFRRAEALAVARGDARADVARRRAATIEQGTSAKMQAPDTGAPVAAGATASAEAASGSSHDTRRWIGAGLAGVGVVGLGVGATFGIIALSKVARSNDGPCRADDHCTPSGLALRHQAGEAATASTIGFAAGAAVLAAGLAVYLSSPRADSPVTLTPMVSAGSAGALLQGHF